MIDSSFISNLRPGKNIFFVIYRSVVISSVFLIFIFRISELFDIIIEYPDSLPAIYDLKVSIKRHAQVCYIYLVLEVVVYLDFLPSSRSP